MSGFGAKVAGLGARDRDGRTSPRTPAQWLALALGVYFVLRGVAGVFLDFDLATPGEGWHALFHVAAGVGMVLVFPFRGLATPALIAFGLGYLALSLIGVVDGHDAFGLVPLQTEDNVTHGVIGAVALAVGLYARSRTRRRADG